MNVDCCVGFMLGCIAVCALVFVLGGCDRQSVAEQSPKTTVSRRIKEVTPHQVRLAKTRPDEKLEGELAPSGDGRGVAVEDLSSGGSPLTEDEKQALSGVSDQLRDAFDLYAQGGNDPSALAQLQRALMAIRPTPFLRAAREMVRFGSAEEKKAALQAIGIRFARNNNVALQISDTGEVMRAPTGEPDGRDDPNEDEILPGDSADGEKKVSQEERRAKQTQAIVESVASAFADADESVRHAAVEAAMSLPKEESGILVSRLMSEGDAGLQTALLEALADSREPSDLVVSIQALSSEDASVAALAANNLKAATGQDFKTEKDAAEWLERNNGNFAESSGVRAAVENNTNKETK